MVEGFGKKRLEGRITLNNETSLIDIATVNESLENSLAIGVFTPTPPKIEDKLRDKLSRQFCQGTVDPGETLIVVLHCSRFKFSHKIPRVETTVVMGNREEKEPGYATIEEQFRPTKVPRDGEIKYIISSECCLPNRVDVSVWISDYSGAASTHVAVF